MSKRNNLKNSEFEYIARSYVKQYGEMLEKENLSEDVQGLKQPKMPEIKAKAAAEKRSVLYKYAGIAATVVLVCVMMVVAVISVRNILNNGDKVEEQTGETPNTEYVEWEAPKMSVVGERFSVTDVQEDNGRVIYSVADVAGDDVVVTLSPRAEADYRGMKDYRMDDGTVVFVKGDFGYKLMAYMYEDTWVEVSCKFDYATLADVYNFLRFEM